MICPQCEDRLIAPNGSEEYCETCGYPDENRCEFNLVEIKAYLRSMFEKQLSFDTPNERNDALASAYNLLTDKNSGIIKFCDSGGADDLSFNSFSDIDPSRLQTRTG